MIEKLTEGQRANVSKEKSVRQRQKIAQILDTMNTRWFIVGECYILSYFAVRQSSVKQKARFWSSLWNVINKQLRECGFKSLSPNELSQLQGSIHAVNAVGKLEGSLNGKLQKMIQELQSRR